MGLWKSIIDKQNEAIKRFGEVVKTPAQEESEESLKERAQKVLNRIKENESEQIQQDLLDMSEDILDIRMNILDVENRIGSIENDTKTEEKINSLSEKITLIEEKIDNSMKEIESYRNKTESSIKTIKILGFIGIATAIILAIAM